MHLPRSYYSKIEFSDDLFCYFLVASASMSEVRRHSTQLRKLSSHFSLNIDAFDTSKSLFDTWSEVSIFNLFIHYSRKADKFTILSWYEI